MSKITLTNNFHNSKVSLIMKSSLPTPYQIKKSQNTLCGIKGCTCGDVMGMRGTQDVKIIGEEYFPEFGFIPRFEVLTMTI